MCVCACNVFAEVRRTEGREGQGADEDENKNKRVRKGESSIKNMERHRIYKLLCPNIGGWSSLNFCKSYIFGKVREDVSKKEAWWRWR